VERRTGWVNDPERDCGLVTNANTAVNASPFAGMPCDGFAPGTTCPTVNFRLVALLAGTVVFDSGEEECNCQMSEKYVNQKYFVINNYNTAPAGYAFLGLGSFLGRKSHAAMSRQCSTVKWNQLQGVTMAEYRLSAGETWFGFILAKLMIPRRWFPKRWCFRIKNAKPR
jgi:hypothetical protein